MLSSLAVQQEEVEAMQTVKLNKSLAAMRRLHPVYGPMIESIGLRGVTSIDDVAVLPLTEKSQLAADPESYRLRREDGSVHDTWDVVHTTGTTGDPTPIYQTRHDYDRILVAQKRMASIRGITSADTIANLFPLAPRPNGSWLRVNDHAFAVGARLVAGMGGPSMGPYSQTRPLSEVAATVARSKPTILWGVGSYIRRFLAECRSAGLRLPTVRMVVASGEALDTSLGGDIKRMANDLGADVALSPGFGASELQCSLVPCRPGADLHNPSPDLFLLQVVDADGLTLPAGSTGRLTITHLDRTGTVLVRYLLGDVVTLERGNCPHCGRAGERISAHHGRGDGRLKVRGQLVDVAQLEKAVASDPGVAEYQIEVKRPSREDPKSMDRLVVRVSARTRTGDPDLVGRIAAEVRRLTSVSPEVEVVEPEAIFPTEGRMKPDRVRVTE